MEQSPLIEFGLPAALMIIMAGMGLGLTRGDFREVFVKPRAMLVGTVAQVAFIPVLAMTVASLFGLSAPIAVGLTIIAACPGGTTSNIFTLLARGNVALSITLTVLASLITVLTLPMFTNFALDWWGVAAEGNAVRLSILRTIITLSVVIILPVMFGMFVRGRAPALAERLGAMVGKFGLVVLVIIILGIAIKVRHQIVELLAQAGPACIALNLAGVATGYASSRLFGISPRDGLTIAIEVGLKNGTIGLMVTLSLLRSTEMAIPSAVYGVLMYAVGAMLIQTGRKMFPA